MQINM